MFSLYSQLGAKIQKRNNPNKLFAKKIKKIGIVTKPLYLCT